ncbi:hypothetical protein SNE40_010143 [Patella caerulea]|uniref:UPAR/Ly6 domain-containing protein qvr n=1 Tax=Patella caerulea TaxID=87958 RepID=A0AAN8K0C4_PATCE
MYVGQSYAQHDYSEPIKCYVCSGTADNSSCADPIDLKINPPVKKVCSQGVCLKWTHYKLGVLVIERVCSADINFQLTLIDGVCRTERNNNGYLCMCGKHLCNSTSRVRLSPVVILFLLLCYSLISQRVLPWQR